MEMALVDTFQVPLRYVVVSSNLSKFVVSRMQQQKHLLKHLQKLLYTL